MNKVISWVKNLRPRQILTVFMVGLTFFVMQAFGYGNAGEAQAETVKSSEGVYYKGTPDSTGHINNGNTLLEKAGKNLKETANDVKEKLNSDELVKTPESTDYKAVPQGNIKDDTNIFEQVKENLKETANDVKEKLNLDEPIPQPTKKFLKSTEERVEDTVEPVTGTKKGYYQEP